MNSFHLLLSLPGWTEWIIYIVLGLFFILLWLNAFFQILNFPFKEKFSRLFWLLGIFIFNIAGVLFWGAWGPRRAK